MATTNHHGGQMPDTSVGHDVNEVDIKAVSSVGLLSLAVVAGSMIAMYGLLVVFLNLEARKDVTPLPVAVQGERQPPAPRLQVTEPRDLASYRSEKETTLTSFGWVDKAAGTVHIPISKAKELVLKRGFPARDYSLVQAAQQAQQTSASPGTAAPATPAAPAAQH